MIEIEGPDGVIYEFPEGTSDQVIGAAMRGIYGAPASAPQAEPQQDRGIGAAIWDNLVGSDDGVTSYGEQLGSWLGRAGESMTLGLAGDELSAAAYGALPGRTYEGELSRLRQNEQDLGFLGQLSADITGAAIPASLGLGAVTAPTMLGRAGQALGIGGGMGATQGFMEGEGGLGGRVSNAITGGALGGLTGFAAPYAVAGASRLGGMARDAVGGGIDTMLGRASQSRADRMLAETLGASGLTQQQVADDLARAVAQGQPEFTVMDALGRAGQRRSSGIVRSGGEGAEELANFLTERQAGASGRVGSFVEDALGFGATPSTGTRAGDVLAGPTRSAAQSEGALNAARRAAANADYSAAREGAGAVDVRGVVSAIDDRLGPMAKGAPITGDSIDAVFQKYRNRLAGDLGEGASIELSDFQRVLGVKQDLQDEIGKAMRAGENNKVSQLSGLVRKLDSALEASSAGYRTANDQFREASRVIEALQSGADMARPSARAADTTAQFGAMTPDQQQAARIGYGDRALAALEANKAPTANAARNFGSPKVRAEMEAMALDPALWADRAAREGQMWETYNRGLLGSRTADNLADVRGVGPLAGLARAARDVANLQPGSAVMNVAGAVAPMLQGANEPTRQLVARALMSSDPAALAGASRSQAAMNSRQQLLEALLTGAERGQVSN